MLGGGEKIDAETLSCLDKFSESIKLELFIFSSLKPM